MRRQEKKNSVLMKKGDHGKAMRTWVEKKPVAQS
jgi:hypothetical protein